MNNNQYNKKQYTSTNELRYATELRQLLDRKVFVRSQLGNKPSTRGP